MSSPEFEPSPYGTAVSAANHYTGVMLDECTQLYVIQECTQFIFRMINRDHLINEYTRPRTFRRYSGQPDLYT
ncbi:hypothetical protein TNCV_2199291 [Trichonephila clavipes]|nr:hypothetical protein TNCV_2199291 [Trichonephila clavipes]